MLETIICHPIQNICLCWHLNKFLLARYRNKINRQIVKYFKIIVFCFLIASVFSLSGVFVLQSTSLIGKADSDFKNLPYGIAIGINLCLFLGSFTILLNLQEHIRTNILYKALSFFLLPCIFVLFLLLVMWDQPWPGVLFCVPYLVFLFIFFVRSKKQDNRNYKN